MSLSEKLGATSSAMGELAALAARLAASDVTITILGETGTGKDVLARAIHDISPRQAQPFVVFDCGAIPPNLIESELFGHEKGAFTGAHAEHRGALERAKGGTLLLDEIGELPLDLQPRLLRVLDDKRIRRVGGSRDHHVDVRILAATNRDLASLVTARQFRQDLYFRLAGAVVHVPALRDRIEDLEVLISRLLSTLNRPQIQVTDEALALLAKHPWPGNVRELKNTLACALAFVDGHMLEPKHLRFVASTGDGSFLERLPLGGQTLESIERAAIKQTLLQNKGSKASAAKLLGIAPSTLYEKLKRYGIDSGS